MLNDGRAPKVYEKLMSWLACLFLPGRLLGPRMGESLTSLEVLVTRASNDLSLRDPRWVQPWQAPGYNPTRRQAAS